MLGGNAMLALSLAIFKAGAAVNQIPLYKHIANLAGNSELVLPIPAFNVINGGSHAGNGVLMQDFLLLPVGASSIKEAWKMAVEVHRHLKAVSKNKNSQDAAKVGDTGGIIQDVEALELLKTAIRNAGYAGKVFIGINAAAPEYYGEDKTHDLNFKEKNNYESQKISGNALEYLYQSWGNEYPKVLIEDLFDQNPWEHLLLKVNEMRTVTEIIEVVKKLKMAGREVMASFWGSSREPLGMIKALLGKLFPCFGKNQGFGSEVIEDTFIADLAVGLAMGQIKTGAPYRSGRLTKCNRFLQIEKELGAEAVYAGANFRKPLQNEKELGAEAVYPRANFRKPLQIEKELGAEAVYAGANFCKPVEPY